MNLDPEILRKAWPKAPQAKIDTICRISEEVFAEHDIDTPEVVVQLMANISHENGAGTIVRERAYSTPERAVKIFGAPRSSAGLTLEEARRLMGSGRAPAFFERVYGIEHSPKLANELGNKYPGDGYKFRGAGDLQLTGRYNFERIGRLTGYTEIIDNPDLMEDPEISFRVAVAEFAKTKNGLCIKLARSDKPTKTEQIRKLINGGTNGMAEVKVWVARWQALLPDAETPVPVPRGADTGNRSLASSRIMKGVVTTAATTAVSAGAKVAENANTQTTTVPIDVVTEKITKASDAITTVQVAVDSGTAIVQTVKPFLGIPPNLWAAIAIGMSILAIGTLAYTGYQRYAKWRDTGE